MELTGLLSHWPPRMPSQTPPNGMGCWPNSNAARDQPKPCNPVLEPNMSIRVNQGAVSQGIQLLFQDPAHIPWLFPPSRFRSLTPSPLPDVFADARGGCLNLLSNNSEKISMSIYIHSERAAVNMDSQSLKEMRSFTLSLETSDMPPRFRADNGLSTEQSCC